MKKQMNWRVMGLATVAGAAALGVAAQTLTKPNLPPVARAVRRDASGAAGSPASAPEVRVDGFGLRTTSLAAEPPIREMFRPLVVIRQPAAAQGAAPTRPVPALPPAGNPAAARKPQAPSAGRKPESIAAAASAPQGPRVEDILMMGVIELDEQPQVLLKNSATGASRYFSKGEEAFGFKVEEIRDSQVVLAYQGKTTTLGMSSEVALEGPGSTTVAGSSGYSSGRSSGASILMNGISGRSRRSGRENGNWGSEQALNDRLRAAPEGSTSYAERLKQLDAKKGEMDPERYQRLRAFLAKKADEEAKGAK